MSEHNGASGEGWNVWSKYVLAELKRAGVERAENKESLEKFIEITFNVFVKEEHKSLEKRMVKVERVVWAIGGVWAIFVVLLIWWIQQILSMI